MKLIDIKTKSGIYCILNVITQKVYVGSSKNIYHRVARHKSEFIYNRHPNLLLQNSVNKHGLDKFICFTIEYCEENLLLIKEQFWLDILNAEYNITKIVARNIPSEQSKIKISDTLKERYKEGLIAYNQEHNWKEVHQYSLEGIYVKSFLCLADAAREVKCTVAAITIPLSKDVNNIAKGYQWSYIKHDKLGIAKVRGKKIYIKKDDYYQEFNSLKETGKILNIPVSTLEKNIKNGHIKSGVYKDYELNYLSLEDRCENTFKAKGIAKLNKINL